MRCRDFFPISYCRMGAVVKSYQYSMIISLTFYGQRSGSLICIHYYHTRSAPVQYFINHQSRFDFDKTVGSQSVKPIVGSFQLTSPISAANFRSCPNFFKFSFIGQLFVRYHHLRTFAPSEPPLSCALLFQCRQPSRPSVRIVPWRSGCNICKVC